MWNGMRLKVLGPLCFLLVCGLILQALIQFQVPNMLSSICIFFSSIITFFYLFSGKNAVATKFPLSSLALIGLNVSTQSGVFFYTSFSFTPVSFNLRAPAETFFFVGLLQLSLLVSHFFYARSGFLAGVSRGLSSRFLTPLGVFREPAEYQLWLAGLGGVMSIWLGSTALHDAQYGDAGAKFIAAFIPFAYAPFLIPFVSSRSKIERIGGAKFFVLLAYFFIMVTVGLAKNSRGVFAIAAFSVVANFIVYYLSGRIVITRRHVRIAVLLAIPGIFLFIFVSDLATAMVLVRDQRGEVVGFDLIQNTLSVLLNREQIADARINWSDVSGAREYNEIYITNPVFARLLTVKFDDNMFYYSSFLSGYDAHALAQITREKIIAFLPTPIINLFGLGVDKNDLAFSVGDYIYYMVSGVGLWGYRTGSVVAHGLIVMGAWFFALIVIVSAWVFALVDAFFERKSGVLFISPIALLFIFSIFNLFNGDSILVILGLFLRGLPQFIALYLVFMLFTGPRKFLKKGAA